ncbi:MAG: hypothetical protein V4471_00745 [Pseudomonadota bacterium]
MLHKILKAKGKQLANKPKQRLRWWSDKCWYSVIFIIPKLTEDTPLWDRTEISLASIRLFGLTPEQLQVKLQHYWSKPTWQQWLQRWFSSINQQLEVWSYYQQCLVFREVQREEPEISFCPSITIPMTKDQHIMEKLAAWLSKSELQFETRLSKYSAHWLTQHFESELSHYETQREKKFFEKLQQELKKISRDEAIETKKEIEADYQKTAKTLRDYLSKWYHATYLGSSQAYVPVHVPVTERSVVPTANPSTSSGSVRQRKKGMDMTSPSIEKKGLSTYDPSQWINAQREQISAILEKKEQDGNQQIVDLLNESFGTLTCFIDSQLVPYREIINEVLIGNVDCEAAVEFTIRLQSRLSSFYRKGSRLFHPDKTLFKEWGHELNPLCHTLFLDYKKYVDTSLGELDKGQKQLKEYISHVSKKDKGMEERLSKKIDQLAAQLQVIREEMEEIFKKHEAKAIEREEKLSAEMEAITRKQDEKLNQLIQSMEKMESELASQASNQSKELISEEKPTQDENEAEEQRIYFKP